MKFHSYLFHIQMLEESTQPTKYTTVSKGTFLITYHHQCKHKHLRYLLLPSKSQVQILNFTFIVLKKKKESNTTNTKYKEWLVHEDETMPTYFIKVLHKISLQRRIVFILSPKFFDLFGCKCLKRKKEKQKRTKNRKKINSNTFQPFTKLTSKNIFVPLMPPPRSWHISCKAADSLLLFSSFGTPSDGVISPTIAVAVQMQYQPLSFSRIHK